MAFDDESRPAAAAQLLSSAHYTRQSPDMNGGAPRTEHPHDTDNPDVLTTIRAISTLFGRIKGMLTA